MTSDNALDALFRIESAARDLVSIVNEIDETKPRAQARKTQLVRVASLAHDAVRLYCDTVCFIENDDFDFACVYDAQRPETKSKEELLVSIITRCFEASFFLLTVDIPQPWCRRSFRAVEYASNLILCALTGRPGFRHLNEQYGEIIKRLEESLRLGRRELARRSAERTVKHNGGKK